MVKIHFFQKVLKIVKFQKKLLYFFLLLGGGPDPKVEISIFFLFFEPFRNQLLQSNSVKTCTCLYLGDCYCCFHLFVCHHNLFLDFFGSLGL